MKKHILNKNISVKKLCVFSGAAAILIFVVIALVTPYSRYARFENACDKSKYEKAFSIYEKLENKAEYKLKSESYIINCLNKELDKYKNKKITVEELGNAIEEVKLYFDFPELSKYSDSVRKAIESEASYNAAVVAESEKRYADAILLYRSILMYNPEYETASERIPELEEKYREYIEASIPLWREKSDYLTALWEINIAGTVFEENAYAAEKEEFELIKQAAEKEFTAQTQLIYSYNERISHQDGNNSLMVAQVQNNSDKTIKEYTLVFCGYDNAGTRLKFSENKMTGEFIKCYNKNTLLKPGENTGSTFGWNVSSTETGKMVRLESCIVNVVYEDGTKWENPYYKFWCDERDIVDYKK